MHLKGVGKHILASSKDLQRDWVLELSHLRNPIGKKSGNNADQMVLFIVQ